MIACNEKDKRLFPTSYSSPFKNFSTDFPHSRPKVIAIPRLTPGVGVKYSVPNRPLVQFPEANKPEIGL